MTRDEIIKMARAAGFVLSDRATDEAINRFRALLHSSAAAEREACARIVEAPHWKTIVRQAMAKRAAEIRARGQAECKS